MRYHCQKPEFAYMAEKINLALFKLRLEELKKEVMGLMNLVDAAVKPVELDQNKVGRLSRVDALQGQAMAQASAARQQALLSAVERALLRIESGEYGRCLDCDGFVAVPRLTIDPTAEMCIDCAQASERH